MLAVRALAAESGLELAAGVAVADGHELAPVALGQRLRDGVGADGAAVSRVSGSAELRRSFHEARLALEAAALGNGCGPQVGSWQDLGAFQLLLSVQGDDALRLFSDSVLEPLEEGEREYGAELVRSLEAFSECNGQWGRAARELFCHRHTLRYRIRQDLFPELERRNCRFSTEVDALR